MYLMKYINVRTNWLFSSFVMCWLDAKVGGEFMQFEYTTTLVVYMAMKWWWCTRVHQASYCIVDCVMRWCCTRGMRVCVCVVVSMTCIIIWKRIFVYILFWYICIYTNATKWSVSQNINKFILYAHRRRCRRQPTTADR